MGVHEIHYELSEATHTARLVRQRITAQVDAEFPPGTPFRRQLSAERLAELTRAQGLDRLNQRIEELHREREALSRQLRDELRRQHRRAALLRSPAHQMAGILRRLRAARLLVRRSNRSETVYVGPPSCELRLSYHNLGWADYGSREQVHHGPEVVADIDDSPAEILEACIAEFREAAQHIEDSWQRKDAASTLRGLRLAYQRSTAVAKAKGE